jgi:soluble lytic murein transglycosylase-like protein
MQPVAFCNRCRGMKVGWNQKYVIHCLVCQEWLSKSFRVMLLTGLLSSFVFAFPVTTGISVSESGRLAGVSPTLAEANAALEVAREKANAANREAETRTQLESLLSRYGVAKDRQSRVVNAVMDSSIKYKVDPRLVASIMIVESGANPFAVSTAESVGIMQIHLRTWGQIAEKENINLFKIEDNVDFGVRILRDYIVSSDTWEGVARYRGKTDSPESQQGALEYVQKVQRVYGMNPDKVSLYQ